MIRLTETSNKMIFDESYKKYDSILDEIFDRDERLVQCFSITYTRDDLSNIPAVCAKVEKLLSEQSMTIEENEIKRLSEMIILSFSAGRFYSRPCYYLVSNGKMAQVVICENPHENNFTVELALSDLKNSIIFMKEGFKKC